MARSKSRRLQVSRHNPIAAKDGPKRDFSAKRAAAMPLIAKLESVHEKERSDAVVAIGAMLTEDSESRKVLLKNGVLTKLLDRFSDDSHMVAAHAAGSLRNLVFDEDEGAESCEALHKINALSILETTMQKSRSLVQSFKARKTKNADMKYDMLLVENTIAILLAFCETSDAILKAVNRSTPTLAPLLFALLELGIDCPEQTRIIAGQCLLSFTDSNEEIKSALLSNPTYLNFLLNPPGGLDLYTSTLLAGVVQNVLHDTDPSHPEIMSAKKVSDVLISRFSQALESVTLEELITQDSTIQNQTLSMLELSLECLAKAALLDNEDSSPDSNGHDAMDIDESEESAGISQSTSYVLSLLSSKALLSRVMNLGTPLRLAESDKQYPANLELLHLLALDFLHNLAWSMAALSTSLNTTGAAFDTATNTDASTGIDMDMTTTRPIDWSTTALGLWSWCANEFPIFLTINEEISESSTSLLYALARHLRAHTPVHQEDVATLIKLYHSSLNADLQSKIVGLLGCLGHVTQTPSSLPASTSSIATTSIVSQSHARASNPTSTNTDESIDTGADAGAGAGADAVINVDINRSVGVFLISVLVALPNTDADSAIESLSAIFDLYADKSFVYDTPVFQRGNFLAHLERVVPKVRHMRKAIDRRTQRGLWNRADEALDNLVAFIEYKRTE